MLKKIKCYWKCVKDFREDKTLIDACQSACDFTINAENKNKNKKESKLKEQEEQKEIKT